MKSAQVADFFFPFFGGGDGGRVGRRMRWISEVIRRDIFPKTGVSIKEAVELLSSR